MAILTTSNLLSEQRYDSSDARRIESGVRNDFDTTVTSIFTNTGNGYIIRGFSLVTAGAIGAPANGLQMVVDPGAVLHVNASVSGTIFQTPIGTPNQVLNAATNTNVSGSFTANSTNYIGIDYNRFADASTDVTKYIWNSAASDETTTIAPAAQTLTYEIFITTSVWASNVLPIAIVKTDGNGNVTSITDARGLIYSLGSGGIDPNPNYVYPWSAGRTQSPTTITATNSSADPFIGGDKQLACFKDWANAVMTTFIEITGAPYWFSGPGSSPPLPLPSLKSLFQDLGNTVITGSGEISNGILPNSDSILTTTGTISSGSNQLTSLASTSGLAIGDFIFATGIPSGTTIASIAGSTVTMSQNATLNGVGISVTFYSPSVITTPGQINWNDPIEIRVIGSSLTYTIAANPSSTDITLTDDQSAYISLVREQPITPNLIFVSGSPTITSVGAVTWTAGLLAGDYVKVASDTSSGYYQISSVDSGSQVTLSSNVVAGDNYPGGIQAQYAYGSYTAVATPSTNRDIYIASRAAVPISGNTFWLFLREDNSGPEKVYVRFLGMELDNGESVNVSGTTSLELLQYIGASSSASSKPQYTDALNPGSVPQITDITIGAGSTITGGQYFLINSSANARQYVFWFKVSGSGTAPVVANTNAIMEVDILSSDSATTVASKLAAAFNSTPFGDFSATSGAGTLVVTNTSAGAANAASNGTVGAPFAITTAQSGTGTGNYIVHDGDNLTLAIKELDQAYGELIASLDSPTYDEVVEVVASGATPPTSITGPISIGTTINLPPNSREGDIAAQYTVGKGTLMVFLNGQFLDLESGAYNEVGANGTPSSSIQIQYGLVVGDELEFRFSGAGGGSGGGLQGPAGPAGPTGPQGQDALGGPVAISTKTSSYTVLDTDCFLLANCTSGTISFTLPAASSVTGQVFYFKKSDSSANYMNIVAAGSDLIDGVGTQSTNTQYTAFSLISTGTGWAIF